MVQTRGPSLCPRGLTPPSHKQEGIGLYQSSKIVVKETLLHLLLTWLFSQINVVVAAG